MEEGMESTPLLLNGNGHEVRGEDGDYMHVSGFSEVKLVFWIELKKLWKIAAPIVLNTLCQFAMNSVTIIFVGHIGDVQLAAVSIALTVIGTFSFGFMWRRSLFQWEGALNDQLMAAVVHVKLHLNSPDIILWDNNPKGSYSTKLGRE
ncbi:hypothetical protein ACFE04_010651 [Oxalis oulophora]